MVGIFQRRTQQPLAAPNPFRAFVVTLAAVLSLGACATSQPTASDTATNEPARMDRSGTLSYDGLTPLEDTLMSRVWVRDGFSLSEYRKVILEGAGIRYRPVTRTLASGQESAATEFPISAAQKAELEALITEEFDRALDRLTLPEVTAPGPDVLLVRGFMLDVVSRIPPQEASSDRYFIDSVGQATFVVELIDSQTGTVLVRAVDTRSAIAPGDATTSSNAATSQAQVRALIARWADLLVDALNDLTAIDELQGA
ncbi:MAG: DUF3313 family protein [Pseudomonadota bacterium]